MLELKTEKPCASRVCIPVFPCSVLEAMAVQVVEFSNGEVQNQKDFCLAVNILTQRKILNFGNCRLMGSKVI